MKAFIVKKEGHEDRIFMNEGNAKNSLANLSGEIHKGKIEVYEMNKIGTIVGGKINGTNKYTIIEETII